MDVYATLEQYSEYLQGRSPLIDTSLFAYYANKASRVIDEKTYGNIPKFKENPNLKQTFRSYVITKLAICTCEVAELIYQHETDEHINISSEKVGGYSVSYSSTQDKLRAYEENINKIIKTYLFDTTLIYRGVY